MSTYLNKILADVPLQEKYNELFTTISQLIQKCPHHEVNKKIAMIVGGVCFTGIIASSFGKRRISEITTNVSGYLKSFTPFQCLKSVGTAVASHKYIILIAAFVGTCAYVYGGLRHGPNTQPQTPSLNNTQSNYGITTLRVDANNEKTSLETPICPKQVDNSTSLLKTDIKKSFLCPNTISTQERPSSDMHPSPTVTPIQSVKDLKNKDGQYNGADSCDQVLADLRQRRGKLNLNHVTGAPLFTDTPEKSSNNILKKPDDYDGDSSDCGEYTDADDDISNFLPPKESNMSEEGIVLNYSTDNDLSNKNPPELLNKNNNANGNYQTFEVENPKKKPSSDDSWYPSFIIQK